jgi:spectinomycin phosphotransferase
MRDEPDELGKALIAGALRLHWGIDGASLEYAPVGAGSYHWIARETTGGAWFLTADNLGALGTQEGASPDADFAGLQAAFLTAAALRAAGLSFVVAPEATRDGEVVVRVLPEWSLAVFPLIEGEAAGDGGWTDNDARLEAARLVGRLHAAEPPSTIRRWTPNIAYRDLLSDVLKNNGRGWTAGPFADRARSLLAKSRQGIEASLDHYDALAAAVMKAEAAWVVTHGEPHSANFIKDGTSHLHLIDWDTLRLGPPERDLWIVVRGDSEALAAYQAEAGPFEPRPEAMDFFDLRWTLADICVYLQRFHEAHEGSEDDRASWEELSRCVSMIARD